MQAHPGDFFLLDTAREAGGPIFHFFEERAHLDERVVLAGECISWVCIPHTEMIMPFRANECNRFGWDIFPYGGAA